MGKLENKFQRDLIKEIKTTFPGSIVLKNDSSYIQGIPDLTVLFKDKWAMLEVKRDAKAPHRPNQDYYVPLLNSMSYSSFVYPENKDEVIRDMSVIFLGEGERT